MTRTRRPRPNVEPPGLDPSLTADLTQLRARIGPDALAKNRMWQVLDAELGPGGGDDGGSDGDAGGGGQASPAGSGAGQLAFVTKVVGATASMTAAGLLVLRLAVVGTRALTNHAEPEPTNAEADRGALASLEPGHDAPLDLQPAEQTPEPARSSLPTEPVLRPSSPKPRLPADTESSLSAELDLIRAAKAATTARAALVLLERHRSRFPAGQLADERELLRIEALCQLGRPLDAEAASEALEAQGRVGATRIHEACARASASKLDPE